MKIKTLLFLTFLVASICLFIFLVWPEWGTLSAKRNELSKNQEIVASIQQKNSNINNLISSLSASENASNKEFVLGYLSSEKKEEKILSAINKLASDEGVVLANVSFEEVKEEAAPVVVETTPENSKEALFNTNAASGDSTVPAAVMPRLRTLKAKVLLAGKYDTLKNFIGKVYALDMMKKVSGLKMASVLNEKGDLTDVIAAEVVFDFNYLPKANVGTDYSNSVFGLARFDFKSVDTLKTLLSQKAAEVVSGTTGRPNPFLP